MVLPWIALGLFAGVALPLTLVAAAIWLVNVELWERWRPDETLRLRHLVQKVPLVPGIIFGVAVTLAPVVVPPFYQFAVAAVSGFPVLLVQLHLRERAWS
jgi:hypothetical protein